MALRVASVHRVTGVEATAAGRDRAAAAGLRVVESVSAIGDAELAVVMVATPGQLVHLVDHAIDSSVTGRLLWLIMSTVGPAAVREQGARLTANGARVLDAPVTGGIPRANTGELTIFASGTEPDLAAAASTLSTMGVSGSRTRPWHLISGFRLPSRTH